jgi:hypothetical protein
MAGDVARITGEAGAASATRRTPWGGAAAAVTERAFEEYHLYTLERPTTVLDREIKQVEFVRASNVPAERIYVYDGFKLDPRYRGWDYSSIRTQAEYGTASNPKVWVMLEFKNSEASHLGMPLPKGKVKVYRRDVDGRNEFIGEDQIDHTPKERLRLYTGNALMLGERRQTNFRVIRATGMRLRSRRGTTKRSRTVRVVEHMYR